MLKISIPGVRRDSLVGRYGASQIISRQALRSPGAFEFNSSLKKGSKTACHGYDVVSYFYGEPKKGDKKYEHEWMGYIWRFGTKGNLKQFKEDPSRFAPEYGGFCAYHTAIKSEKSYMDVNPRVFCVYNDSLYLFYNQKALQSWALNVSWYIHEASQKWDCKTPSSSNRNSLSFEQSVEEVTRENRSLPA